MKKLDNVIIAKYLGANVIIDSTYITEGEVGGSFRSKIKGTTDDICRGKNKIQDILNHASDIENPVLIDIGANYGSYTLLPMLDDTLTVHAFEPIPRVFMALTRNVLLNNITNNVSLYPIALWNTDGKIMFNICESKIMVHTGGSAIDVNGKKKGTKIEVETRKLDSYNFEQVDIIKIDVEGAELMVLQGAIETLERCKPSYIQLEFTCGQNKTFHYTESDLVNFMTKYGYKGARNGGDYIFKLRK